MNTPQHVRDYSWTSIREQAIIIEEDFVKFDIRLEVNGKIYTEWTLEFEQALLVHRLTYA